MSDFTTEVGMAGGGLALSQGQGIPATDDKAAKRALTSYMRWFEGHKDWFSDALDAESMEFMIRMLAVYGNPEPVRGMLRTDATLLKTFDANKVQNWYTKYTMFDPTMGMYDPDEGLNYFRQRLLKRFNILVTHIENRVHRSQGKP